MKYPPSQIVFVLSDDLTPTPFISVLFLKGGTSLSGLVGLQRGVQEPGTEGNISCTSAAVC